MINHSFQKLSDKLLEDILKKLTYTQIVNLRLIDKWFYRKCSRILNSTFLSLKVLLESLIESHSKETVTEKEQFCYKIYHVFKSEITVLYAVCGRYILFGIYCFTSGAILDCYSQVIQATSQDSSWKTTLVTRLFVLNQRFMDYFEETIEPNLLKRYPTCTCYGTKLMDLLDAYLYSNFNIKATYDGAICSIFGCYEILDMQAVAPPIKLIATQDAIANQLNLFLLMKYFRNQVRWNNFFHCMDSDCKVGCKKSNFKCKFCLNTKKDVTICENFDGMNGLGFDKTFSRHLGNPSNTKNIYYTIELQCSVYCTPMRLSSYIRKTSKKYLEGLDLLKVSEKIAQFYKFNMQLKVILPSGGDCTESNLKLSHDRQQCVISQETKKIPL